MTATTTATRTRKFSTKADATVTEQNDTPQVDTTQVEVEATETETETENVFVDGASVTVEPQPTTVDVTALDAEARKALIKQLAEQNKAEREARKAERQARQATKSESKSQDLEAGQEFFGDIAHKLAKLDLTVTNSEPRGFRRSTGNLMVTFTETDDEGNEVQVERLVNITCTMRVAQR